MIADRWEPMIHWLAGGIVANGLAVTGTFFGRLAPRVRHLVVSAIEHPLAGPHGPYHFQPEAYTFRGITWPRLFAIPFTCFFVRVTTIWHLLAVGWILMCLVDLGPSAASGIYPQTQQGPASPIGRDEGHARQQCSKARNGASAISRQNRACIAGVLSARVADLSAAGVPPEPSIQEPSRGVHSLYQDGDIYLRIEDLHVASWLPRWANGTDPRCLRVYSTVPSPTLLLPLAVGLTRRPERPWLPSALRNGSVALGECLAARPPCTDQASGAHLLCGASRLTWRHRRRGGHRWHTAGNCSARWR